MRYMDWLLPLYGITFVVFSGYLIWIGMTGLTRRRPLVVPANQLMWFLLLIYFPLVLQSLARIFVPAGRSSPFFIFTAVIQVLIFIIVVVVFRRQMTGYMVFGSSEDVFRDSLHYALNKLGLPFQEGLSKIRLTSLEADLQAAVAGWVGTAQFRIKQQQHARYSKEIARLMQEYYRTNHVEVNNIIFITYLLLGIIMAAFVVGLIALGR